MAADADFIIEILARLRDEASPGLAKLKAEINSLKSTQDAESAERDLGNAIKDTGDEADKSKRKHESLRTEHEKSRRAAEDASRGTKDLGRDVEQQGRAHDKASESVSGHTKTQRDFADALAKVREESSKTSDGAEDLDLRISKLRTSWGNFARELDQGGFSKGQAKRGLQEYSTEFSFLMRKLETGSQEWRHMEAILDRVNSKLSNPSSGKSFESLNDSLSGAGSGFRVTGVASFIRGLQDLLKIGLAPQLITGIASLAGGLFSIASAATQAGAALAGAFISGLGQAIPMLSIVAASLERFKNILQAVSVAGQAEQQHFYDPTEKQVLQLQQTSQIISANQQLSNSYIQLFEAQQRVRDSQIALTEARYNAQRQITELSLAEKDARLQAEGANISLLEAKRQLQIAIQRGDVAGLQQAELAVKEAELSKKKADFEIPKTEREARLARQRGVSGAPSVISAVEGLEGSKVALLQAQQAGEAARRQKQITELQQQARSSKETQYESQLKFLEKGMSPTELGLTNALIGIEKELKSPNSPLKKITDYLVEPFTNAIEKIRSLLKDSSFLEPIDELAKAMGDGLSRLEKSAYGKEGTSFFEQMARDAKENIPSVSQSIERLMKVFEDIAKSAGPAFHKLSEDWDKFWGQLDIKYGTPIGFSLLEKFFNKSVEYAEAFGRLGKALYDLFISVGHDAAPQGLSTVTGFTGAVKNATEWVKSHGSDVTKFFKEAREGLETVGGLLLSIGKDFLEAFSLSSLRALSGFLSQFLLPGLRDVINIIGKITTAILNFFNLFGSAGRKALEVLAAFVLGFLAITKAVDMIKELQKAFIELKIIMMESPWIAIATGILSAAAALGIFDSAQKKNKISTEEVDNALERQANALRTIKSLNDEYASSKLSVEEANTRVIQSEQSLTRAKSSLAHPERPLSREERAEAITGIKQDEQSVIRAKLSAREAEENFAKLPEQQRETAKKEASEVRKSANEARTLNKQNTEELRGLEKERAEAEQKISRGREVGGSIGHEIEIGAKSEVVKINEKITSSNKKLKESQELLGTAVLRENEAINSSNTLTSQGASKLSEAYSEAFSKFEESIRKGGKAAHDGMGKIRDLVDNALKKYGVTPAEITGAASGASKAISGAAGAVRSVSRGLEGFAAGGYIPAKPGGQIARVGEGGHDEVVLSTDPRHASRSRALLGQYFSRAPHMAEGGIAGGYEFPLHGSITRGRTDQGVDYDLTPGSPITSIGDAIIKGVVANWFKGQPFIWYELLSGLDKGKNVYVAEQINRLAQVGSTVRAGQPIAYYAPSGTGIEIGWATPSGQTLAGATTGYREGQVTPAGSSFGAFLAGLQQGKVVGGTAQMAQAFKEIIAPKIKGGGAIGQIAQGALNLATKAANIYLSKQSSSSIGEVTGGSLSGGPVGREIMNYFTSHGFSRIAAAGIIGNFQQESSLDPNAPGGGLDQGIGSRFHQGSLLAQLNGILNELLTSEAGTAAAIKRAKSAREAALIFSERFERPGIPDNANREQYAEEALTKYALGGMVGDSVRRLAVRHLRKKILRFAQGGIAPWGGRPVPIIAHEGERIMNPAQYHETARLAGTTPGGLDKHLGYDGSPRQSFAGGGQVTSLSLPGVTSLSPSASEIGTISTLIKVIKAIAEGFEKIGSLRNKPSSKIKSEIATFFENIEKAFEVMNEGREALKARLARGATSREYRETGVIPAREYRSNGGLVRVGRLNQGTVALGPGGEAKIAEEGFKALREENIYIENEMKSINDDKKRINSEMKKSRNKASLNMFKQQFNSLVKRQRELGEAAVQNIEARYQAETQTLQTQITEANNQYQVISQEHQTKISKAQAFGNLSEVGRLEEQSAASAQAQIAIKKVNLIAAEKIGSKELESSIKQEIISLEQTINSAVVERISNAQTLIQRESQAAESRSGERLGISKVLAAEGKYEAAGREERTGLTEKQSNLLNFRTQEEQLKEQALREGDTAKVIELTESLNKNSQEIAENNLALKENAVVTRELILSQIGRETSVGTGIYGSLKTSIETIGKITGFTNVSALLSAVKGERGILEGGEKKYEEAGTGIGFKTKGMTPEQILQYLASPQAQTIISRIETSGTEGEKADLEKWLSGIEGNSVALLKNTEEIARLNGQLNQPQSFSTAAFNAFRTSFFTGMGGLLPPYSAALPPGSRPEGLPVYGSGQVGAPINTTHIENLSIPHPVEVADPNLFAEELSHAISTTPPTS